MAKPEWGSKRLCASCGARFYDLQRDPIECPKCGTVHDPLANVRQSRSRAAPAPEPKAVPVAKKKVKTVGDEEDDDLPDDAVLEDIDDDDEDDDLIEDAAELGEEDDVIDVAADDDEDDKG